MPNRSQLSQVRAAAGRAGAAARWAGVERKPTEKVRIYAEDADRLRAMPGTMAEAVHRILGGKRK
ncbi:MAG: hypothetical protein IIW14_07450 [Kiritimatiellae bacterium]|nr:hypothetical protein [Kiritimatiellia bacterium]